MEKSKINTPRLWKKIVIGILNLVVAISLLVAVLTSVLVHGVLDIERFKDNICDQDFDNVIVNNPEIHKNSKLFPRDKLIRMAGNSIPVKLLEGIFYQIKQLDEQLV